ncbi:MAG: FtsW/RodA/SpoVE family cell cycle protein [Actinomycetota bacterium]|nr:FtsW/RodA/SpoVE family cell cycle protein [Actinomycetota bacterium]
MTLSSGPASPPGGFATAPAPRTRRGAELLMLAFAAIITTSALVLVEANQEQRLSTDLLVVGGAYLGLFTVAHLAVRKLAPYADPLILPCVALLNGLGLVMIHRLDLADVAKAVQAGKPPPGGDATHQVVWTTIGLVLFLGVLWFLRDHRSLARYGYTCGLAGLVLLITPAVLPARFSEVNGGKNWILLAGFSIQPGEFAKILLLIFSASFLVAKRDLFDTAGKHILGMDLPRARDLAPMLLAWGVSIGVLVFDKDLGFALLIFGTVLVMLYVATERVSWLLIGSALFVGGCVVAYHLFTHVQVRVQTWLDPAATYDTTGYQISQSLFGLGTGGVGGTGLGAGRPETVPFAKTDFIIAAIGEELGLIGIAAVLMVFAVLVIRGMRTAIAVRDTFGKLLAGGLAFTIAWQVFVVVGGVTKLIPLTGLTTPFVSYGGSSLLANYVLVAILLRISDAARRPAPARKPRVGPATPIADAPTQMVKRA